MACSLTTICAVQNTCITIVSPQVLTYNRFLFIDIPCSTFEGNYGTNGVVSVAYAPVTFNGYTIFKNNTGTSALRV